MIIRAVLPPTGLLPITPTTITFSYTDSEWGDLLTAYNGHAITYDEIGNPLSYYNGSAYTFTWEGRRLVGAVKGSNNLTFIYNDEGIRTSKSRFGGIKVEYLLNGTKIVAETSDTYTILYIYDASDSPIGMRYRSSSYAADVWNTFWFEKNLQGDIVAVYNSDGVKCISYIYDAWGKILKTTTHNSTGTNAYASRNPFRYRGYYYDVNLRLYYLQSRYYDHNTCRFISPDNEAVLTATPMALTDKNLYAYCDNNPVTRVDGDGEFWHIIAGAAVGAVVSGIVSIVNQLAENNEVNWGIVGVAAAAGALSGALATVGAGPVAGAFIQMAGNAIISAGESIATQAIENKGLENVVVSQVLADSIIGGVTNIGNGLTKGVSKHLMTQGIQATKQIAKKGFTKAAKYYLSQTSTLFYKPLINDAIGEITETLVKTRKNGYFR